MLTIQDHLIKADYVDENGIQRRVELPAGATNYHEGIPVSLDVDRIFAHCSIDFRRNLVAELWAHGLVEPCDFLVAGAPEKVRSAIQACVKLDTLDILTLASSECKRGQL
jgi:hypothetical protein